MNFEEEGGSSTNHNQANRCTCSPPPLLTRRASASKIAARAPVDALRDGTSRARACVMGFVRQSARVARAVRARVDNVRACPRDFSSVRCFSSSWSWREDAERRRGIRAARAKAKRGVRDAVRRAMSEEEGGGEEAKTKRRGGTFGHEFLDGFDARVESSTRRRGRYGGGGEDQGRASSSSSSSSWRREPRGRVKDVFDDDADEDVASMFWSRAGPRGFGGGMDDPAARAAFRKMFVDDFERLNKRSSSSSSSFSFSSPRRAASDAGFFASSRCPHCVALGISDRDFITWDELKLALRTQAMKWHPDRHDDASKTMAEAKFKGVYDAYEALARDKV